MRLVKLLSIVVALSLSGCGKQPVDTNLLATQSNAQEVNSIYDVFIDGKKFTAPFKVSELVAAGYKIRESTVDKVTRGVDNIVYYTDRDDGMIVVNLGSLEPECEINDAYIIDILADNMNTETTKLSVYGGISFDSTKEDVAAVYGEPVMESNGMSVYSRTDADAYMDGVYVMMDGDAVARVEVLCTKDFIDWNEEELEEFESESVSE